MTTCATPLLCQQHGGRLPEERGRGASDSCQNWAPGSWLSLSPGRWLRPPKDVMWGSLGCSPCWSTGHGGQSALSIDVNKLDLCTAVQPELHVRLLWRAFRSIHPDWFQNDCFETGGEDLPDAYRYVPMGPEESWACVVAYYDPVKGPCFRRYFGMLFGLLLAVTSFNRFRTVASVLQETRCLSCIALLRWFDCPGRQEFTRLISVVLYRVGRAARFTIFQWEASANASWRWFSGPLALCGTGCPAGRCHVLGSGAILPEDNVHDPGGYSRRTSSSRCGCKDLWLFDLFEPRMLGQGGPGRP